MTIFERFQLNSGYLAPGRSRLVFAVCAALIASVALLPAMAFFAQAQSVSPCDICFADNEGRCRLSCENVPSGFAECKQRCMQSRCGRKCSPQGQGVSPEVANEVTACQTCMEYAKRGACLSECEGSEQRGSCVDRCAKFKCTDKCGLPVGEFRQPDRQPMTCSECKDRSRSGCQDQCGEKGRPGYVACEVSCIETKCLETCNKHLF